MMEFGKQASTDTLNELKEAGNALWEIKIAKDALEKEKKELNAKKTETEAKVMAILEEYGLSNFDFGPAKVSIAHKASAKCVDKYAMKVAMQEMIVETAEGNVSVWDSLASINSASLNKWFNDERASKEESGEYNFAVDGIDFKEYSQLRLTKNKG